MHGPLWLENPTMSVLLIAVAFYLLYKAVTTQKHLRHHQHSSGAIMWKENFLDAKSLIQTKDGYSSHLL
jgi:hypothetical protein